MAQWIKIWAGDRMITRVNPQATNNVPLSKAFNPKIIPAVSVQYEVYCCMREIKWRGFDNEVSERSQPQIHK